MWLSHNPRYFPDIELRSTNDKAVNLRQLKGRSVVFIYPYTGRPGFADPPGWDEINGAHGSTPQALGYKALYKKFREQRVRVFGLSFQNTEWQQEFVARNQLPFALLSDDKGEAALQGKLETFKAGQMAFLKRRTMFIENGRIILDRKKMLVAQEDAAIILDWLGQP
jgi:peroxiredoxin